MVELGIDISYDFNVDSVELTAIAQHIQYCGVIYINF